MNYNKQSKTNQKNTFNAEMKKTNIYQNRKNLHEFFKKNHYIYQEFMNESNHKIYRIYKDFEESYSEIFADVNMMITESIHHDCKTSFISHNKLHDHIHIKCKSSVQSLSSTVLKNSKSIIIKLMIKSKKLLRYSFKE